MYMFINDYNTMCTEVYKHQHIETGGNLFGLWTTSGSAIIHVMLGPGQNCKRTSTSFHQDLNYMERVGRFVNDNYMLCHIGEWHSHHNLSLSKPSAGDESTIRRNFPQGMLKFLVIIANIRNGDTIKLSPYFFTDGGTSYEIAECVVLDSDSPFSTDDDILSQIKLGAEVKENRRQNGSDLVVKHSGTSSKSVGNQGSSGLSSQWGGNTYPTRFRANQSSSMFGLATSAPKPNPRSPDALVKLTSLKSKPKPSSSDSLVNQSKPNTYRSDSSNTEVAPSTPPSTANPSQAKSHSPDTSVSPSISLPQDLREPMDTEDSDLHPPEGYYKSSASHPPTPQHDTFGKGQADPKKKMNVDAETPSKREIIFKKIHDHLKYWYGRQTESSFKFQNSEYSRDTIEVSFKHNKNFWMVCFPKDFPDKPAELFCSRYEGNVRITQVYKTDLVEPLDNEINILLSIKRRCGSISGKCNACRNFTRELLSQFNPNFGSWEKLIASASKLADDITRSLIGVDDLSMKCVSESQARITFKYKKRIWVIEFSPYFPEVAAKVHYLAYEWSSQKCDVILHGEHSYGPQKLNTSKLIIEAIANTP